MSEATKLQALVSWVWNAATGKAGIGILLMIAVTAGVVWMSNHDRGTGDRFPVPAATGTIATERSTPGDTGDSKNGQSNTTVTVHGDGIAAGRDAKVEGDVKFQ